MKKIVKFAFSSFWSCRAFKIPHFYRKMCLSRLRETHKLSKIWLFKFQVLEISVLSKSLIFVKRGVWLVFHQARSSQNEQSLYLQEKTSESCLWASNTLVQKPCSFKFFGFLEENCGADLSRWVSHTFLQKRCSFKSFTILEENCAADIIDETFKCKSFVGKCCKSGRWVSYTFLQKPSLFNLFRIRASFWRICL